MIIDISNFEFKKIFADKKLFLPIRWDGNDFLQTLNGLFDYYINKIKNIQKNGDGISVDTEVIKRACKLLTKSVSHYLNGFPSKAYNSFKKSMTIFMGKPLKVYQKSDVDQFSNSNKDSLKLFRVVLVNDNKPYERKRVFHTPYNLRSKVSTNRYSIAGYPSLYLGTSLDLCCKELQFNPHQDLALASIFKFERTLENSNIMIKVIELGVKPQDFIDDERNDVTINYGYKRRIDKSLLDSSNVRDAYLLWYPLIAACSYIRDNKKDPFAVEYIIPQLLMQWVRSEIASQNNKDKNSQLIGIRYFSCASERASNMGFNYVFPTSGEQKSSELPYCSVLAKSFYLCKPVYIHEFDTIDECERYLKSQKDFDFIG